MVSLEVPVLHWTDESGDADVVVGVVIGVLDVEGDCGYALADEFSRG